MATEHSSYVNNLNGKQYTLPTTFTGSFREDPYFNGSIGQDTTRSNARIRALAYVWMAHAEAIDAEDPAAGPFITDIANDEELSVKMRGNDNGGNIAVFSDCGYASEESGQEGGATCEDEADAASPWDFFTDAFGENIKTYFTPSKDNDANLPDGYNSLDIWQATGTQLSDAQADVVIVSDIVQLCAPTQYNNNNEKTYPDFSQDYIDVSTVFKNLFNLTKPGGLLIFSVPYDGDPTNEQGEAVEVIGNIVEGAQAGCGLWNWGYDILDDNSVIKNTNNEGVTNDIKALNFTGGINCPAILRTFTRGAVYQYLNDAGFQNISFLNITNAMNSIGIFWDASINAGKWVANNSVEEGSPASKSLIVTATRVNP